MNTPEDYKLLNWYIKMIKNYIPLDKTEQNTLIKKAQKKDKKAMAKVIENNLPLVLYFVKHLFYIREYTFMEIVSLGNIGLIKAIKSFDDKKNVMFSTYAGVCIIGEIRQDLRHKNYEPDCFLVGDIFNPNHLDDIIYSDDSGSKDICLKDMLVGEKDITTKEDDKQFDYAAIIEDAVNSLGK